MRFVADKLTLVAILGILMAILFSGCGSTATPAATTSAFGTPTAPSDAAPTAAAQPAAGTIELKAAFHYTESDGWAVNTKQWIKTISDKTNGRVKITPFFAGSLVNATDMLDAVREGSVDMGELVASFTSGKIPAMAAFEPIGNYPIEVEKYAVTVEKFMPVLRRVLEEQNLVLLYVQPSPGTSFASKTKFFESPADFQGVKVRLAGRYQQMQWKLLGASPVAIDPSEVYQALQAGTVDAAGGLVSLTLSFKWYEPAPYVTDLDVPSNLQYGVISKASWDRLSKEDQDAITAASNELTKSALPGLVSFQKEAGKRIESAGGKVYVWDAAAKASFYKTTASVWDEVKKNAGPLGGQLVDILAEGRN